MENKKEKNVKKKRFSGKVVSTAMKDTVVVTVSRYFKHPRYKKYIRTRKRYKVHDKGNLVSLGDEVLIEETSPISKDKHFKIVRK
ncbi:MAG: 30S ribosomal protein S17 [Patescibacteria group bacterium]